MLAALQTGVLDMLGLSDPAAETDLELGGQLEPGLGPDAEAFQDQWQG
jgi:hypothetical protein